MNRLRIADCGFRIGDAEWLRHARNDMAGDSRRVRTPRDNPQSAIRNPQSHSGFTLVEAVISTVVVAVMFAAALQTVGAAKITQRKASLVSQGQMLAESLLAEILQQNYQEPGATYVFGREAGESDTIRTAYDDVDDYQGWTESPPVAKDGTALPNSANWRRTVAVEWVNPTDPQQVQGSESGAKRITVVASFRNVPQATVVAIKADN